jgi:SAM-dependent methyltransferase
MRIDATPYTPLIAGPLGFEHVHRYAASAALAGGKRVLDVACGEGYGAAMLARAAASVIALDIDEDAVSHARATYFEPNLRFVRGDATGMPLPDASIDLVVSFATIEQIDEPERMLDEIRRVLAPGGVVVISSPNWSSLEHRDEREAYRRRLDHAEFRDLLTARFASVRVFGQRIVASSVLHPLGGAGGADARWMSRSGDGVRSGLPALPDPSSFIAVCGDDVAALEFASAYLDPGDDLLAALRTGGVALPGNGAGFETMLSVEPRRALPRRVDAVIANDAGAETDRLHALVETARNERDAAERKRDEARAEVERLIASEHHLDVELSAAKETAEALRAELAELRAEHERVAGDLALWIEESARGYAAADAARAQTAQVQGMLAALQARADAATIEEERLRAELVRERAAAAAEGGATERLAREQVAHLSRLVESGAQFAAGESSGGHATNAMLRRELLERAAAAERDSLALQAILNSKSWRVTAPLRFVLRALGRR